MSKNNLISYIFFVLCILIIAEKSCTFVTKFNKGIVLNLGNKIMININGKSLNDYIKEESEKFGVLDIIRATERRGSRVSSMSLCSGVITGAGDKRYENAEINFHLFGNTYHMKGNVIERKDGLWYVDGTLQNIPKTPLRKVPEDGSVKADVYEGGKTKGMNTLNVNIPIDDASDLVSTTFSNSNSKNSKNRTVRCNGQVNIIRGGKTYTLKGNNLEQIDGQWFTDGEPIGWDSIGGQYQTSDNVKIEIHGSVENISTENGDVTIYGNVDKVKTMSGDVAVNGDAYNVNTMSGDINVKGKINGSASTLSGDIYRR